MFNHENDVTEAKLQKINRVPESTGDGAKQGWNWGIWYKDD